MKRVMAMLAAGMGLGVLAASAGEIGFIEDYALATNRADALRQLIPGTEDYYYYSCLYAQTGGKGVDVAALLDPWIKRYGYTERAREIRNRQALIDYDKNPGPSLAYLRRELDLTFDHRRVIAGEEPAFPTRLDPTLIAPAALLKAAFSRYQNLEGIEDAGLDLLAGGNLGDIRRRDLLGRLKRPDYPDLPRLVVDDLRAEHSGGFGSIPIHASLLHDQLLECARLMPELWTRHAFVEACTARLLPGADADIRVDRSARRAFLERLTAFTRPLPPAFNSLKAHALYPLLDLDRREGRYDFALFLDYLKLPRLVPYINPVFAERPEHINVRADLNADFRRVTSFPPIRIDDDLVRDYLGRHFLTATNFLEFAPFIRDDYLQRVFAETKLVNGLGDAERWFSLLPAAEVQTLKDRVDLDFAVSNREFFAAADPVTLDVHTKNVGTLIIKVFELNAFNYYLTKQSEIEPGVDLDGLVATEERVEKFNEPPMRRVLRSFAFPGCARPGVYVIELIGNGRSSRAVVRKGYLHTLEKPGPAGHEFIILDEANRRRPEATLWLGGREYRPGKDGVILVPYSTEPEAQSMILREGDLATLATLNHRAEEYALSGGFYVDREALLKGQKASLLVRPVLKLNGYPVSLTLLEQVKLTVQSTDRQGINTVKEVPGFALAEDRESVFEFQVPENLARIRFTLSARVRNLSRQRNEQPAVRDEFALNDIDATPGVEQLLARQDEAGYGVDLLGKNGEAKARRPVHVELKHRAFRDPAHAELQTDEKGHIALGPLEGIDWFTATGPGGASRTWRTGKDEATTPGAVHGLAGRPVRLPFFPTAEAPARQVSLLELRGGAFASNRLDAIQFRDGFLEIADLPAGDYDLYLKDTDKRVSLRLTAGETVAGHAVSRTRTLETINPDPLTIAQVRATADALTVTLANARPHARLHVLATRYLPAYWVKGKLDIRLPDPVPRPHAPPESIYVAGRDIGDEYRYVLDRKYADPFPGVMLERPSLLLAPWSLGKTETGLEELAPTESLGRYGGRSSAMRGEALHRVNLSDVNVLGNDGNLDFLAEPSALLLNLKPDSNGVVRIERKALGPHAYVRLVVVDPFNTVCRRVTLPAVPAPLRDLRLPAALAADTRFTEQKVISILGTNAALELKDLATSEFALYDSVDSVFTLLSTLNGGTQLVDFAFLPRWPDLKPEEQRDLYSRHACHELNFFLYHKDRPFFDAVIKPFLANKKDKTFLDAWLTGEDLAPWTQPWAFGHLNVVERALLARRGAAPAAGIARHVAELADRVAPDPDDFNRRFDTGIRAGTLETGDAYGVGDVKKGLERQAGEKNGFAMEALPSASDAVAPMAPPPAAAPADKLAEKRKSIDKKSDQPAREEAAKELDELSGRLGDRRSMIQLFRQLDKTEEWAENNYYHRPIREQDASLVAANPFWADYARHDGKGPFLSRHFLQATSNLTEVLMALAVLDVPFKAAPHASRIEGAAFTLRPGTPLVAFHQEIRPAQPDPEPKPILVSQNYYRADDRYSFDGNERSDKFVTDEFLVQVAYGCQVVLVNPTSSRQKLRLLLQIPQGAIPVQNGFRTRGFPVTLEPFATRTIDYFFYFPRPGSMPHYPVQVAREGWFVAGAPATTLKIVEKPSRTDTESWDYISQDGTPDEMLAFLRKVNLNRIDLDKIAWRMKDKAYFRKVLDLLEERHIYHGTLWSYGLFHNDPAAAREFLKHSAIADRCGLYLDTTLLRIDPVERKVFEHLEYKPLVNARAHQVGRKRQILNDRFLGQYQRFLAVLGYKPALDPDDLLGAVYYLLLQDRVAEAARFFAAIKPEGLPERLQYDYLQVVLDFYKGNIAEAGEIAGRYLDYPVPRWRNLFAEARAQLDELSGKSAAATDADDRLQAQSRAAAGEPSLMLGIEEKKRGVIFYQNLTACRVNYYPMDVELLFSQSPFVQQDTGKFRFVRPAMSQELALPADKDRLSFEFPQAFANRNMMVEVVSGGNQHAIPYFANALAVQVIEPFGQLRVNHATTGKPLGKVYVKVYARMEDGSIRFFKDGYTDLRGRFDYASLSTGELSTTRRFSILVLSDEFGAVIQEVEPPER